MAVATAPRGKTDRLMPVALQKEYVADGRLGPYIQAARVMPWAIDDLTADLGDDLYERMQRDPQVKACVKIWKASIIEDGATLSPAITDATNPDYATAKALSDTAAQMLDDLDTPFDDVLWNMLDACCLGNKVAEVVWKITETAEGPRWDIRAIKPKPRRMVAFVVDTFMNVVGIVGQRADSTMLNIPSLTGLTTIGANQILPRDRFAILTFQPENSDPRGTSMLRAAYDPWVRKRQLLPEYVKYLSQFATPSAIGTVGEDADDQVDDAGNVILSAPEALAAMLSNLRNAQAVGLPFGTTVKLIESQGDGVALLNALSHADQQIVIAVLAQTLATMEGEHQARAAAQVHLEVLDTIIRQAKKAVTRMIRRDLLRMWVTYNWGPAYLPFLPIVTLTDTEQRQKPALWAALAQLVTCGYIQTDQYPAMDALLGIPSRDLAALLAAQQAAADAAAAAAQPPAPPEPPGNPDPNAAPADQAA